MHLEQKYILCAIIFIANLKYIAAIAINYPEEHVREKRYLGLSKLYKLNRQYQECVGPGDVQGHCKHVPFCPMDIIGNSKATLDFLCIIEKRHVGVCCPDDILLGSLAGSQLIGDLPAGGEDYDVNDNHTGCGLTSLARATGNTDAKATAPGSGLRWPWIAALYRPADTSRKQFCGGALITDRHVLTAAHCLTGLSPGDLRVRLGEYDFGVGNETRHRDFAVSEVRPHEEFSAATYENDVALLTLSAPANFHSYVWPICLPPLNRTYANETVTVAGWGQQFYAGPTSQVLLEVSIPVWDQKHCEDAFAQRVSVNNLCAAAYEGGKDACLGDSGGPLLYQLANGRWVTIGIVSWGIGCGIEGQPGIYARVDKYIPWIVRHTIAK